MKRILFLSLAIVAMAIPAHAQILIANVNMTGANPGYSGPAVTGIAGDYWNATGSSSYGALFGTDGLTNTGLSLTWSGGNFPYAPGTPLWSNSPTPGITEGITTTNNVTSYTISGFTIGQAYTFDFLNATNTTGRVSTITLTGSTTSALSATMNTADTTWINGNEYVQFLNVTPNATTGNFSFVLSHGAGGEGDLNGIQILTGAVPEPSTYAMMCLGLAGLILTIRHRRSSLNF